MVGEAAGADVVGTLVDRAGAAVVGTDVVGTDVVGGATVGEKVASASVGGSVLDDAWHSHIASLVPTNT